VRHPSPWGSGRPVEYRLRLRAGSWRWLGWGATGEGIATGAPQGAGGAVLIPVAAGRGFAFLRRNGRTYWRRGVRRVTLVLIPSPDSPPSPSGDPWLRASVRAAAARSHRVAMGSCARTAAARKPRVARPRRRSK
jgi:hypothetical protein